MRAVDHMVDPFAPTNRRQVQHFDRADRSDGFKEVGGLHRFEGDMFNFTIAVGREQARLQGGIGAGGDQGPMASTGE